MQHKTQEKATHPPFLYYFPASTLTAIVENFIFFPLIKIGTCLQNAPKTLSLHRHPAEIKQLIFPNVKTFSDSVHSLYTGLWANIFYRICQRIMMYAMQPIIKDRLDKKAGLSIENRLGKSWRNPLLAGLAGIGSSLLEILFLPFNTVSIRMQTKHCTFKEAWLGGNLYNGSSITAVRNMLSATVLFSSSSYLHQRFNANNLYDVTLMQELYAAAVGSVLATLISHPPDTIKTVMQGKYGKQSIVKTIATICAEEGYKGLMRGWVPRLMKSAPSTIFSMTVTNQAVKYAASVHKEGLFAQKQAKKYPLNMEEVTPPVKRNNASR